MRPRTLALFIFSVMALVAWLGLQGCGVLWPSPFGSIQTKEDCSSWARGFSWETSKLCEDMPGGKTGSYLEERR